jgi:Ca2+-binding RTX toxin-like protein
MSTLLGTDADESILPGDISPTVIALAGPLVAGADADVIIAGGGNDTVNGGGGNDTLLLGDGNDRAIWNPGDGSDVVDGAAGADTMEFNGSAGNEVMRLATLTGGVTQLTRDIGNISMTLQGVERVVVNAGAGDDSFEAAGNLAPLVALTVDGGAGNDRILGSNGNDVLLGGDGNDFIDGQQGADVAFLGAGDDVFQWDPGDGSDVIEGQAGGDSMLFNGSAAGEIFDLSANGGRASFTRNVGNIAMDLNDVERIELHALAGADTFNIRELNATDLREIAVDLAETTASADAVVLLGRAGGTDFSFRDGEGGLLGDGLGATVQVANAGAEDLVVASGASDADDQFEVSGGQAGETFRISAAGTDVVVDGLGARIGIRNAADAADNLIIKGNAGDDTFEATGNIAALTNLVLDGGAGNDRILGGNGAELLLGGAGDDFVDGQQGNDVALLGAGNDVFQWDPGDGSDVVEGQAGTDTMLFNGSAANEVFSIAANGARESFRRDVGNIAMDIDGIERIEARAGAGNDTIDASGLLAGRAQLGLFGDDGDDRITGSAGVDFINGGRGTDTVTMGAGNDRFQWNPGEGSDVVDGQAGFDTHEFNGSNANERFALNAGGRDAILTRDVGNIVMDQSNIERVELLTAGGGDTIEVGDLRGTDVRELLVDLAGAVGGTTGDGAADLVTLNAGAHSDLLSLSSSGDDISIDGLAQRTRVANADATDTIAVNGGAGADLIDARSVSAGSAGLVLDGGSGNDALFAGRGAATLLGGTGNDLLVGGAGADVLRAGGGRDVLIGNGGDDLFAGDDDFTVIGFRAGAGTDDRIDLREVAGLDDFADVMAIARFSRVGVTLDFGDDEITLLGVSPNQLHADDFLI